MNYRKNYNYFLENPKPIFFCIFRKPIIKNDENEQKLCMDSLKINLICISNTDTLVLIIQKFLFQNEAGKMLLEGTLCSDFYVIQDLLYKQYAII